MELLVIILGIWLISAFTIKGKKARERQAFNKLSSTDNKEKVVAERQRKQQETDELITVILPTINNDK